MFTKPQYQLPHDFEMGAVKVVDVRVTAYGRATVEAWDTATDGRLFYALDEAGALIAPATPRKLRALLVARTHVRWHDHLRDLQAELRP